MTSYADIRAVNWSSLKHMNASARLYRYRLDHPEPPKPMWAVNSAIHCLALEPDKFPRRYAECAVTRNPKHKAYQAWLEEHDGAEALRPDEMARVRAAVDALMSDPHARPLIEQSRHEETIEWIDPVTGLACKGRVDAISDRVGDLKLTRGIAGGKFDRDAATYCYHGQLGFYHDGATLAKLIAGDLPPYIIAMEDQPPFDVGVFHLDEVDLQAGRNLYREILAKLQVCLSADEWPGSVPEPRPLLLPAWAPGLRAADEGF